MINIEAIEGRFVCTSGAVLKSGFLTKFIWLDFVCWAENNVIPNELIVCLLVCLLVCLSIGYR